MTSYDFTTLSPSDFEILVRDLLKAEHNWPLEAFGHGPDGGIDLRAFAATAKIVVQCKHYAGSRFADLRAAARRERPKIASERPARYLLVTSQNLSRTQKDTLASDLEPYIADPADIVAQLDLNEMLGRHRAVEQNHFKLWLASVGVLERVVNSGQWERSEALMESICDRVKLYVQVPSYQRARAMLESGYVVALTGGPGVGKTTLAEMLALSYWHSGWQVVTISSDIDEAWNAYRRDRQQVFLYDDFLGQTDLSERRNKNESARIVRFIEHIQRKTSKRFIMTTRTQVLRQAELRDEEIGRGNFDVRACIVPLSDYGILARARILYNHLYFSHQPRSIIKEYVASSRYWAAVKHRNFTPRVIEQIFKRPASSAEGLATALEAALDRPIELWRTMFVTALSEAARSIVLALVSFPPEGPTPDELRGSVDCNAIAYTDALKALEGTWITIGDAAARQPVRISYASPSCRDFVLAFLDAYPDYACELVLHCQQISQVQALLAYAAAKVGRSLKYPGTAGAITAAAETVSAHIKQTATELVRYIPFEGGGGYGINTKGFSALVRLIDPARLLLPDLVPWLIRRSVDTVVEHRDQSPFKVEDLAELTEAALNERDPHLRSAQSISDLALLFETWVEEPMNGDDVLALVKKATRAEGLLGTRLSVTSMVENAALENLRSEISDARTNSDDGDQATSYLAYLEDIAKEAGLFERLRRDFESEYQSIAEWEDERRSEYGTENRTRDRHSQQLEQGDEPVYPSAQETERVADLFTHLQ